MNVTLDSISCKSNHNAHVKGLDRYKTSDVYVLNACEKIIKHELLSFASNILVCMGFVCGWKNENKMV